ncbi:MAG: hypothetical protein ACREJG_00385 [Candidatus Rokuibacteriota bacterium]
MKVFAAVALLSMATAGCALSGGLSTPGRAVTGASLEPLIVGWERFFNVSWQAGERRGEPIVYGRVSNEYGSPAARVQLLVESLDGAGQVTAQRVAWLGRTLGPFDSSYFEAPVPRVAPAYRVSVFAFDWLQAPSNDRL